MKKCPVCGRTVNNEDRFCSGCGYDFFERETHIQKKLCEKKFYSCEFSSFAEWLKEHNGHIRIADVQGDLEFYMAHYGGSRIRRQWFFQELMIRYYEDEESGKRYGFCWQDAYDNRKESGKQIVTEGVKSMVNGRRTVSRILKGSYLTEQKSWMFWCGIAIYELEKR